MWLRVKVILILIAATIAIQIASSGFTAFTLIRSPPKLLFEDTVWIIANCSGTSNLGGVVCMFVVYLITFTYYESASLPNNGDFQFRVTNNMEWWCVLIIIMEWFCLLGTNLAVLYGYFTNPHHAGLFAKMVARSLGSQILFVTATLVVIVYLGRYFCLYMSTLLQHEALQQNENNHPHTD